MSPATLFVVLDFSIIDALYALKASISVLLAKLNRTLVCYLFYILSLHLLHISFSLFPSLMHVSSLVTMRILNWNTRGLGDSEKTDRVFEIIQEYRPDFVCLQETKLQVISKFKAHKFLPPFIRSFFFEPSDGSSGGILIAWNPCKFKCNTVKQDRFSITVAVSSLSDNMDFIITTVYAPCLAQDRPDFFQSIP